MKQELDYIRIDGALGGNQDWFTDPFMKGEAVRLLRNCGIPVLRRKAG